MRTQLAAVAIGLAILSPAANAQSVPYAGTAFIPGLGDGPNLWYPAYASHFYSFHLGNARFPVLPTTSSIADQRNSLLTHLNLAGTSGPYVLLAHSMGGLVARSTAQTDPTRAYSIVTVATPIRGARIAQEYNTNLVKFVVSDAIGRVQDVITYLPLWQWYMKPTKDQLQYYRSYVDNYFIATTSAWQDLRPGSAALSAINNGTGPNIPVAQVVANAPPAKIHFRMIESLGVVPYSMQQMVNGERGAIHACKLLANLYGFVFRSPQMMLRCLMANMALDRIDVAFLYAATGKTPLQQLLSPVPFDGVVGSTDVQWTGWGNHRGVFVAQGDDHISVQDSPNGVLRQREALSAVGTIPK